MTDYKITATKTDTYEIIVTAESAIEALEIAQDTELNWNNYTFISSDVDYSIN